MNQGFEGFKYMRIQLHKVKVSLSLLRCEVLGHILGKGSQRPELSEVKRMLKNYEESSQKFAWLVKDYTELSNKMHGRHQQYNAQGCTVQCAAQENTLGVHQVSHRYKSLGFGSKTVKENLIIL
ncbi:hypothetical protein PoB_005660800 [Plakobranchus ocellatus]|uniref:Uncharacterized protein n=1 Tax=Plakobranchus ocellatus TaxID=259542 RepID=A0AAV4CGH1_9GAST|nr:hypothetical protein PoB_005660800 [Plakobranchus ocellatus]